MCGLPSNWLTATYMHIYRTQQLKQKNRVILPIMAGAMPLFSCFHSISFCAKICGCLCGEVMAFVLSLCQEHTSH